MKNQDYFLLYAHNVAVRGRDFSAIYDLRGGRIQRINNRCFDLLAVLKQKPVQVVRVEDSSGNPGAFDVFLQTLLDQNLGFLTPTPQLFPALDLTWTLPNTLHTAIVEHDFSSYDLYRQVLHPLHSLLCRHVEFRLRSCTTSHLFALADYLADKTIKSVSFLVEYEPFMTRLFVEDFYERCPKIDCLLVYNAPQLEEIHDQKAYFVTRSLDPVYSATPRYVVNVQYFTEAQQHNPYYNRKVAIDRQGYIRNCLQLAASFGNVTVDSLPEVVRQPEFQELWFSSPDRVADVQDSPFRYALFLPYGVKKTNQPGQYQLASS